MNIFLSSKSFWIAIMASALLATSVTSATQNNQGVQVTLQQGVQQGVNLSSGAVFFTLIPAGGAPQQVNGGIEIQGVSPIIFSLNGQGVNAVPSFIGSGTTLSTTTQFNYPGQQLTWSWPGAGTVQAIRSYTFSGAGLPTQPGVMVMDNNGILAWAPGDVANYQWAGNVLLQNIQPGQALDFTVFQFNGQYVIAVLCQGGVVNFYATNLINNGQNPSNVPLTPIGTINLGIPNAVSLAFNNNNPNTPPTFYVGTGFSILQFSIPNFSTTPATQFLASTPTPINIAGGSSVMPSNKIDFQYGILLGGGQQSSTLYQQQQNGSFVVINANLPSGNAGATLTADILTNTITGIVCSGSSNSMVPFTTNFYTSPGINFPNNQMNPMGGPNNQGFYGNHYREDHRHRLNGNPMGQMNPMGGPNNQGFYGNHYREDHRHRLNGNPMGQMNTPNPNFYNPTQQSPSNPNSSWGWGSEVGNTVNEWGAVSSMF